MVTQIRMGMDSKLKKVTMGGIKKNLVIDSQIQGIITKIIVFPDKQQGENNNIGYDQNP
jgi:hypothetical protein